MLIHEADFVDSNNLFKREGKLSRLISHPVANFVVARAVERISAAELLAGLEEMKDSWSKIIS